MSKSNAWESDLLNLLFLNADAINIGDAAGLQNSLAAGNLYVALHTADPGEAGTQATSEATYTGYARVAVPRTGVGWTVSGTAPTQVANAGAVNFGLCTAVPNTITHFSVGKQAAGATDMLYSGALTASLAVSAGITPSFAAGALVVTED
jgi:hypothetical protein